MLKVCKELMDKSSVFMQIMKIDVEWIEWQLNFFDLKGCERLLMTKDIITCVTTLLDEISF